MIILSSILGVVILVMFFVLRNLLKKVEKGEDIITDQVEYLKSISYFIKESRKLIDTLDEKGFYKADDELGSFFNLMKEIQNTADEYQLPQGYGEEEK
jgi:hypothetical protein